MPLDIISSPSKGEQLHERLTSRETVLISGGEATPESLKQNLHDRIMFRSSGRINRSGSGRSCVKSMVCCNKMATRYHHRRPQPSIKRLIPLMSVSLCLVAAILSESDGNIRQNQVEASESGMASRVASKLQTGSIRLARKLELAKSSGQINEWLVHQVAPAMANKLINNVLQTPKSSSTKSLSIGDSSSSKKSSIDTQVLADKIVDKLADSIKKRKKQADVSIQQAPEVKSQELNDSESDESNKVDQIKSRGSNRKGKSLVSEVVQNLFSKDNRKLFGRAMEKSKLPFRHSTANLLHNSSNNWLMIKEPVYDQHLFVSTDSSQLDENPVVLRAEHGHNLTTTDSSVHSGGQNLSPLISSLMSNTATNQMGNKLLQKHRLQQKYVHTNRHHQQHLAPKPWPPAPNPHNRRHQQQSPYSLPVTSDINVVQAPSSPAPPPVSSTSTTTSTTTTTASPPPTNPPVFSHVPQATVTQLGPNKFKINNRHHFPSSAMPMPASSGWYSSNRNHQLGQLPHGVSNNHRYQHHHPSTTSTTTTTTTTTTTPEPPQTEPVMMESMDQMLELQEQTSAPAVSQLLSSVAQSALETLSQAASSQNNDESTIYNTFANSTYGSLSSSSVSQPSSSHSSSGSSSSSGIKGASPSTTTARHSVISAEAIPTALGAPLYHLTRANFTATSIMAPPPRRSGSSPAAKLAAQYFQKGLNNLSSTIFGRQSKNWARRLGLSSVLLSGLLYTAAILANPGAPLPTNGFEVLQALTKNKRRRGSRESLLPPVGDPSKLVQYPLTGNLNAALLDNNNVNFLYQQPQLIPIIEHLIQQEQQQQQNSLFSQRSFGASPIEIESFDTDRASRRDSPSQFYTLQALPRGLALRRK